MGINESNAVQNYALPDLLDIQLGEYALLMFLLGIKYQSEASGLYSMLVGTYFSGNNTVFTSLTSSALLLREV